MFRRFLAVLAAVVLAMGTMLASPAGAARSTPADSAMLPMMFVHGFMGSGQQFEAQALRLTSNGYPADRIDVFEHNSLAYPGSQNEVWAGMDAKIDALLASSGMNQLTLLGHSQGTGVVQGYLNSDPARAAKVAKYVNLDGGSGGTVPSSVDTLAVWAEGDPARSIPGATNIQFANQSHTEVVNSPETFEAIYEFLLGEEPAVTEVVRETGSVTISGRAVNFPENTGIANSTMAVYEVEATTGERIGDPILELELSGDGDFGPITVDPDSQYEFAINNPAGATHHVYTQPFVRSSRWVRILSSAPDGLANSFWEPSATTQNLSVLRNQEWWADQAAENDVLEINGASVLTVDNSPRSNRTIGIFLHDADNDGVSGSVADPAPTGLPFLTGIDLVIPGSDPATGTTSVRTTPRLGDGDETVCLPALSSVDHRMSVQFNSYHHLLNADGSVAAGPANPTCGASPVADPQPSADPNATPGSTAQPASPVTASPTFTG